MKSVDLVFALSSLTSYVFLWNWWCQQWNDNRYARYDWRHNQCKMQIVDPTVDGLKLIQSTLQLKDRSILTFSTKFPLTIMVYLKLRTDLRFFRKCLLIQGLLIGVLTVTWPYLRSEHDALFVHCQTTQRKRTVIEVATFGPLFY